MNAEIQEKIMMQEEYCNKNHKPIFIPFDGCCFYCLRQIFEHISKEKASSELITACPLCHRSYVE